MIRGDNVYEPLSGYGVHGRHNRESTVSELHVLLDELEFEPLRVFTADVSPEQPSPPPWFPGLEQSNRGEYVFVVARAFGSHRWRSPPWLYQRRQALWRVVLPHMEVGRNDDLQTEGFHDRETVEERQVRWMGKQPVARVLLSPLIHGPGLLKIEGLGPPTEFGEPIELQVQIDEAVLTREIPLPGSGSRWSLLSTFYRSTKRLISAQAGFSSPPGHERR